MPRLMPAGALFTALLVSCAPGPAERDTVDPALLQAAWTSGGDSFDFVIRPDTILYEFDMREHPYTLDGRVLVIDFQDPALGIQRKEIVRVTTDELVLRDVTEMGDPAETAPTIFRRIP